MGKYDKILEGLGSAPVADLDYQAKVAARKKDVAKLAACDCEQGQSNVDPFNWNAHADACSAKAGVETTFIGESISKAYQRARGWLDDLEALRYDAQMTAAALEQMLIDSWTNGDPGWGEYGANPWTIKTANGTAIDVLNEPDPKVENEVAYKHWCRTPKDRCTKCGQDEDSIMGQHCLLETPDALALGQHRFSPGGDVEAKMALPWQTTASIAKERADAGLPAPDGVVMYARKKVKLRRAKARKSDENLDGAEFGVN